MGFQRLGEITLHVVSYEAAKPRLQIQVAAITACQPIGNCERVATTFQSLELEPGKRSFSQIRRNAKGYRRCLHR